VGEAVHLALAIACTPRSLHITTATTGRAPDPDGYTVSVDGGPAQPIAVAGSLDVGGLVDGQHTVLLGGLAPFCDPVENPRTLQVAGAVTPVSFEISCAGPPTSGRILFSGVTGTEVHLFSMKPDGSDVVDLTPAANAYGGRWSADRAKIVFETSRNGDSEVFTMNADGSHAMRLAAGHSPTWSPDGTRIAFIVGAQLAVMNADGSHLRELAIGRRADSPSWSPDGRTIAYSDLNPSQCVLIFFDPVCARDIYVVNADGSGGRQVTHARDAVTWSNSPVWSPDGSTIAFWRATFGTGLGNLCLVAPEASQPIELTSTTLVGEAFPAWSPDGRFLAFGILAADDPDAEYDVAIISRQGGAPVVVLARPGEQRPTSWR
jgi:TolB protein